VVERNNSPNRNGVFVQPTLTRARAATMVLDRTFNGTVSGNVFASPLFVDGTPGVFVIATENNQVSVLNETTGLPVWQRTYGTPAGATGAGCGNISPLGITGTPRDRPGEAHHLLRCGDRDEHDDHGSPDPRGVARRRLRARRLAGVLEVGQ
jgi:hypothetical protein